MLLGDFLPDYHAEFMARKVMKGLSRLGKGADDLAAGMSIQKKKKYVPKTPTSPRLKESASQLRAGGQGWGGTGPGPVKIAKGKGGGKYGSY